MNRIDLWALGCSILRGQGTEGYKLPIQILENNQASGAGFSKAPWHRGRGLEVKGKETMSQGPWSVACDQGLWLKHSAPWPLQFLFSNGKSVRTLCIHMSGATAASCLSDVGMSTALNKDKWHLWSQFLHYKRKKEDNTPRPTHIHNPKNYGENWEMKWMSLLGHELMAEAVVGEAAVVRRADGCRGTGPLKAMSGPCCEASDKL